MQALPHVVLRYTDRIQRVFVPKFYHDKKDTNFLKGLLYIGEKKEIDEKYFYEGPLLGRKLYEYRIDGDKNKTINIHPRDLDWPFPEKYYQSIGYTIHGFSFKFKNVDNNLSALLNTEDDLTNVESGIEKVDNNITEELFSNKKNIEEKIAEYQAVPTKNFVNESFFLYDKSNLIKNAFVTAINKQLSLYGSFSYFSGKTAASNLKLVSSNNFLKFFVEKKSLRNSSKLQLAQVDGSEVKTSDKEINHFSITKLEKRKRNIMSEPVETILIRVQ